jgi:hypothetical protein
LNFFFGRGFVFLEIPEKVIGGGVSFVEHDKNSTTDFLEKGGFLERIAHKVSNPEIAPFSGVHGC